MSHNFAFIRSDLVGVDVIGSSGTPQALSVADTYVAQAGTTDTRDFRQCTWYPRIVAKGTATKITVKIEWSEDGANLASQGTESITDGIATVSEGEWSYDVTGQPASNFSLPPLPLPAIASQVKVSIKSDLGTTTTCYVRAMRQA